MNEVMIDLLRKKRKDRERKKKNKASINEGIAL
jgi:hypothetical protein